MYNLKPHSAFKLLTMAAGYKVFCPVAGFVDAKCGGEGGRGTQRRVRSSAIQKFDLFERRLRTAGGADRADQARHCDQPERKRETHGMERGMEEARRMRKRRRKRTNKKK